ncbi:hypothetical protein ABMA27_016182 [Loxostege sticticalis]|uniref:Uncharacterized protein n=1 Tax=Loxostege sticticalis TaxID=481309 RepID=A0ABR3I5U1_LOXSC
MPIGLIQAKSQTTDVFEFDVNPDDNHMGKVIFKKTGDISNRTKVSKIQIKVPHCMELTVVHVEVDNPVAPPFVSFDQNDYMVTINYRKTQNSRSTYAVVAKAIPISSCYIHEDYEEYVPHCMELTVVHVEVDNPVAPPFVSFDQNDYMVTIKYRKTQHSRSTYVVVAKAIPISTCYDHEDYEEYIHDYGPKDYEESDDDHSFEDSEEFDDDHSHEDSEEYDDDHSLEDSEEYKDYHGYYIYNSKLKSNKKKIK